MALLQQHLGCGHTSSMRSDPAAHTPNHGAATALRSHSSGCAAAPLSVTAAVDWHSIGCCTSRRLPQLQRERSARHPGQCAAHKYLARIDTRTSACEHERPKQRLVPRLIHLACRFACRNPPAWARLRRAAAGTAVLGRTRRGGRSRGRQQAPNPAFLMMWGISPSAHGALGRSWGVHFAQPAAILMPAGRGVKLTCSLRDPLPFLPTTACSP